MMFLVATLLLLELNSLFLFNLVSETGAGGTGGPGGLLYQWVHRDRDLTFSYNNSVNLVWARYTTSLVLYFTSRLISVDGKLAAHRLIGMGRIMYAAGTLSLSTKWLHRMVCAYCVRPIFFLTTSLLFSRANVNNWREIFCKLTFDMFTFVLT